MGVWKLRFPPNQLQGLGFLVAILVFLTFISGLSINIMIRGTMQCSEMLRGGPLGDAIAVVAFASVFIIVVLFAPTWMKGTNHHLVHLKSATSKRLLSLICYIGVLFNGVHAQMHDPNDSHNLWTRFWQLMRNCGIMVAAALSVGLVTFGGVRVAGIVVMSNFRSAYGTGERIIAEPVPEIPEAATGRLQIYPEVQGNDFDNVLANAPVATRSNSPVSPSGWL